MSKDITMTREDWADLITWAEENGYTRIPLDRVVKKYLAYKAKKQKQAEK